MKTSKSPSQPLFQLMHSWFMRSISSVIAPVHCLIQLISLRAFNQEFSIHTNDNNCLVVGKTFLKSYQDNIQNLQMKKLITKQRLHQKRETLCQLAREHRQLLTQLKTLEYKEDCLIANRAMLLELLQETSTLRQSNVRLKADLQLLECRLQSMEIKNSTKDDKEWDHIKQKRNKSKQRAQQLWMDCTKIWEVSIASKESRSLNSASVTSSEQLTCLLPVPD